MVLLALPLSTRFEQAMQTNTLRAVISFSWPLVGLEQSPTVNNYKVLSKAGGVKQDVYVYSTQSPKEKLK
jgi:hypothetical protein